MELCVKRLVPEATLPTRGSEYAAGYDLYACDKAYIPKRGRVCVKTGIAVAIPDGYYGRVGMHVHHVLSHVAPRSGLAVKHGIDVGMTMVMTVHHAVGGGVIDADYRGEVCVILFNHSDDGYEGMRRV